MMDAKHSLQCLENYFAPFDFACKQNGFCKMDEGKSFRKVRWHFDPHDRYCFDFLALEEGVVVESVQLNDGTMFYCEGCSERCNQICSKCRYVAYCSKKCQVGDWNKGHKSECQKLTISRRRPFPSSVVVSMKTDPSEKDTLRQDWNQWDGWAPCEKLVGIELDVSQLEGLLLSDHIIIVSQAFNTFSSTLPKWHLNTEFVEHSVLGSYLLTDQSLPNALDQSQRIFQSSICTSVARKKTPKVSIKKMSD